MILPFLSHSIHVFHNIHVFLQNLCPLLKRAHQTAVLATGVSTVKLHNILQLESKCAAYQSFDSRRVSARTNLAVMSCVQGLGRLAATNSNRQDRVSCCLSPTSSGG